MVGIYHTGKQIGTYEPLVSYQKKYRLYRSHTDRTGEIRLLRPVNGYRTSTFSHATLNFCLSLPPLYHTDDDEIPIGGEEKRQWYWFMHWKSVLSEEKNYNGLMLKELDRCESCDIERERPVTNRKKWNKNRKSEDKINLKEEEVMCGCKESV